MEKEYYNEINISRAIGIIMVVMFHSIGPNSALLEYIKNIFNTIQMPLFFFISGFVAYKIKSISTKNDYLKFINKKFKRLAIPYLILGIILFLPKLILNKYAVVKLNPNLFFSDLILFGNNPITFLWFLYVLFMIFVIYTVPLRKNMILTLLINLILYLVLRINGINISLFVLSKIIYYANYFMVGFVIYDSYAYIKDKIVSKNVIVVLLSTLYIIIITGMNISSIIINLITPIVGILSVISISLLLENTKVGNVLEYVGSYSYDIYLLSWFGQNIFRIACQIIGIDLYTWYAFVGMFICGISIIFVSKFILRKQKYINKYILGNL